jgi:hypothetical protein
MPLDRVFEYTDASMVGRFRPGGQLDLAALGAIPTLFAQEIGGEGEQVARVGTISRARISGPNVALEFSYDAEIPSIPNTALRGLAGELDIEDFEFSRNALGGQECRPLSSAAQESSATPPSTEGLSIGRARKYRTHPRVGHDAFPCWLRHGVHHSSPDSGAGWLPVPESGRHLGEPGGYAGRRLAH